ncbi:telomere length regulation protein-domain-containing protein [Chytridium lagenaria]|nr:telomere length regulation protein-domain-containing protein [Chytridium lagenaria]
MDTVLHGIKNGDKIQEVKRGLLEIQGWILGNQDALSELMGEKSTQEEALKGSTYFSGFKLEDLNTLRRNFGAQDIGRLHVILFKVVSEQWLPLFSNKERSLLFDEFFVGKSINPVASLESILGFLSATSNAFQLETAERILQLLFERFPCDTVLERFLEKTTPGQDRLPLRQVHGWDRYVALVASLPSRLSNALKGAQRKFFQPENFIRLLIKQVGRTHRKESGKNVASLISRLIRTGHSSFIAEEILLSNINGEGLNSNHPTWENVWAEFSTSDIEAILYPILSKPHAPAPGHFLPNFLSVSAISTNPSIHHVLGVVFTIKRNLPLWSLKSLIHTFTLFKAHPLSCIAVLQRLLSVWASGYFAANADEARFKYVHYAIMLCLSRVDDVEVKTLEKDAMQGVKHYLELNVPFRRSFGLVVTECIFNRNSPVEPLSFELQEDGEIVMLRSLAVKEQSLETDVKTVVPPPINLNVEVNQSDEEDLYGEEDPDMPATRPVGDSDDEDEESDDEDELKPLQSPGFDERPNVRKPVYIGECIDLLKEDKPESTELVLESLPSILRLSEPRDLSENSAELFRRVFQIPESDHIDNFHAMRQTCLLAICSNCPDVVTKYIGGEISSNSYSVSQRIELLSVVSMVSVRIGADMKDEIKSNWDPVTLSFVMKSRRASHFGAWRTNILSRF